MLIQNYVSEENFWVNELIAGMKPIEGGEFVQRIITMGQFLLSKAIEKMPNNPYTGRIVSKRFCKFVNDCVADTSMLKKRINFMRQTTPSQKAHALLYIMHQMFRHENRFAQIYDLTDKSNDLVPQAESMSLHERITEEDHSGHTGSLILQQSENALGEDKLYDIYE